MHTQLLHEARHDGLTGLPNRTVAEDRLEQALARAARRKKSFAVFCVDLDGFKAVNDELGHDAGDELLRAVAVRLRGRIRHSDTLARMGGDEFLVVLSDATIETTERVARRLQEVGHDTAPVSFTLGWAARNGTETFEETVNRADHSLIDVRVEQRPGRFTRRTPPDTKS
jgi:diguanylate cyclase (GGDEF)-like protein